MKIKVPVVFESGTCRMVDWSNTYCAIEMDNIFRRYKLFYNAFKSSCCDVLPWKVEVKGCQGSLNAKINLWMSRDSHSKSLLNLVCCICICRRGGTNCEFHDPHAHGSFILGGGGMTNLHNSSEDRMTMDILDHSNLRTSSVSENSVTTNKLNI